MEEGGFIVLTGMNIGRIRARRGGLLIRRQSVLLGIEFLLFSLVHLSFLKDFLLKLDDILPAIISSGVGGFNVLNGPSWGGGQVWMILGRFCNNT